MHRRIFLGVPLSAEAKEALKRKLKHIPGKVIPMENWHFTLQFLGAVEEEKLSLLQQTLSTADLSPAFNVNITHLNAFPNLDRAKILWLGVTQGSQQFTALNEKICQILAQLHLRFETRPFVPHATISRLPRPENVSRWARDMSIHKVSMQIDKVVLYESHLDPDHARYMELNSYSL